MLKDWKNVEQMIKAKLSAEDKKNRLKVDKKQSSKKLLIDSDERKLEEQLTEVTY